MAYAELQVLAARSHFPPILNLLKDDPAASIGFTMESGQ